MHTQEIIEGTHQLLIGLEIFKNKPAVDKFDKSRLS